MNGIDTSIERNCFCNIKNGFDNLQKELSNHNYRGIATLLIDMNNSLNWIVTHYTENHDCSSSQLTVNLDDYVLIRNLLSLNAIWVAGPFIFNNSSTIDWSQFSSSLKLSEEELHNGFMNIYNEIDDECVVKIIITCLSTGQIEDYEIAGIVYNMSYFLHFIFTISHRMSPKGWLKLIGNESKYQKCELFFNSHLSSYSTCLLITSIQALQLYNRGNDTWLRPFVSELMGHVVMRQQGLVATVSTLLSFADEGDMTAIVNASRGISSCSSRLSSVDYFDGVCRQIAAVLLDDRPNPYVVTTCVHVIDTILKKNPSYIYTITYAVTFGPLLLVEKQPYYGSFSMNDSIILASHGAINNCVRALSRLLTVGSTMLRIVGSVSVLIPALFHMYVFATASKSLLLSPISKAIKLFIRSSALAVPAFISVACGDGLRQTSLRFAMDSNSDLVLREVDTTDAEDMQWILDTRVRCGWEKESTAIAAVWIIDGDVRWIRELFVELLEQFFAGRTNDAPLSAESQTRCGCVLLAIMDSNHSDLFGDYLLKGLQCIQHVLGICLSRNTASTSLSADGVIDIASLCRDLLQAIVETASFMSPLIDEIAVKSQIPSKRRNKADAEVEEDEYRDAVRRVIVAMRSNITDTSIPAGIYQGPYYNVDDSVGPIFDDIVKLLRQAESRLIQLQTPVEPSAAEKRTELAMDTSMVRSRLQSVARDMTSPLEPLRSLALSRLSRLVSIGDDEAIRTQIPEIIRVLKIGLNDEDSYVYLGAVSGLMVLSSRYSSEVLPVLLELFATEMAPLDLRLKTAEAIVCAVRYMQDACVKFADKVMNSFLNLLSPTREMSWRNVERKRKMTIASDEVFARQALRASCLSSIAELATYMKYAIEPYLSEIISHCRGVLLFEKTADAVLVRRAAVFLLSCVIKGASNEILHIMRDEINSIRHILDQCEMDEDDIVRGHANASLKLLEDALLPNFKEYRKSLITEI